jgi:Tol biopolymer transport system component
VRASAIHQAATVATLLTLTACGRLQFDEQPRSPDAAPDPDAAMPAVCDPSAPFGIPVPIAELNDPIERDGTLRLAADELSGYFWSYRGGDGFSGVYYAQRPDLTTPFTVQPVTGLSTVGNDLDPTLSTRGSPLLVFRHNMSGDDLWMATVVSPTEFSNPVAITNLNWSSTDGQPFLQPGGDELVFQSQRSGAGDLYRSTRTGPQTFAAPARIVELATGAEEGDPVLSTDGLTLYYRSNTVTSIAGFNIHVSTRANVTDPWGTPVLVPNINSALDDGPSSLSTDGCRLYLSSDRNGTNDIFVATRGT